MADREEYIKVLSKTVKTVKDFNEDAPIKISLQCVEDILALLKEQEAVEPTIDEYGNKRCGSCGYKLQSIADQDLFCCKCGRSVKWE